MHISLSNVSKKYSGNWIFKKLNFNFEAGRSFVILGSNGSGKSTLLQIISGALSPSEGEINYNFKDENKTHDKFGELYKYVSIAAPYMELIEEYTLKELIHFHREFKPFVKELNTEDVITVIGLNDSNNKQLKYFSSGMKQRVRLALAILSDTPVLLLDEPCSNLDQKGVQWYNELINKHAANRVVIVCSNHQENEYKFCTGVLNINDFKPNVVQNN